MVGCGGRHRYPPHKRAVEMYCHLLPGGSHRTREMWVEPRKAVNKPFRPMRTKGLCRWEAIPMIVNGAVMRNYIQLCRQVRMSRRRFTAGGITARPAMR